MEFEHCDEREALSVPPRQEDTHLSPAFPYVTVTSHTGRYACRIEREGRHASQLALCRDLSDTRANFFQF
jgi:hypothetical protein